MWWSIIQNSESMSMDSRCRTGRHCISWMWCGIGRTLFLFLGDRLMYNHHEAAGNRLTIHIEERSVRNLFRKRMLLENINLSVNPGEMALVLGGSGAGKTTFINAVMGYEKAQGSISLDGVDVYKNYNRMKYEIGFVPQQDWLRMDDSVQATLENAAELKLPKDVTEEERRKRVEEVLETLGLESEKKSLVSQAVGRSEKAAQHRGGIHCQSQPVFPG